MERIRVLVVDDELFVGELLSEYLTLKGYFVNAVSNGQEALAALAGNEFDIILLDIRMPGMSGMEVLKAIKKNSQTTRVIMLSAYGDPDTIDAALRAGAERYLQKPMNLKNLVETLESVRQV